MDQQMTLLPFRRLSTLAGIMALRLMAELSSFLEITIMLYHRQSTHTMVARSRGQSAIAQEDTHRQRYFGTARLRGRSTTYQALQSRPTQLRSMLPVLPPRILSLTLQPSQQAIVLPQGSGWTLKA